MRVKGKAPFAIIIVIIVALGLIFFYSQNRSQRVDNIPQNILTMKLESPAFQANQSIPAKYTCDGENISPPLKISDIPEGAKSLVLIMDDPDAPVGVWDHWLAWNIPPEITEISEGQEPNGVVGKNTGGRFGYQGPCPPDREHRYFFKLYALDTTLDLAKETATKADLEAAMKGHILAQAELMGRYNRN